MKRNTLVVLMAAVVSASCVSYGGDDVLWGWSVSAGGNFGFGLRADLRTSPNNPVAAAIGPTRAEAIAAATPVTGDSRKKVVYGKDANGDWFVDPDSSWGVGDPNQTTNWRLPDGAPYADKENGKFVMYSGNWVDVQDGSERPLVGRDDDVAYGASVDFSHMLFESEDGKWGVDVSLGVAWMRANDCYKNSGVVAGIEHGDVKTEIPAECLKDPYGWCEDDDTWGAANYWGGAGAIDIGRSGDEPIVLLDKIVSTARPVGDVDPLILRGEGDYEEWEISVLLKPWYEINDWLCVHGALGVGVTRSSFEYAMEAYCNGRSVYRSSEEFNEWRVYGIAGAGLVARVWDFDLSCDGLFRWCQDDMTIRGRDVQGTIEKPWAVLRLGLSYCF